MTDELPFTKLDPDAVLPERAHPGDAGLDLRSAIDVEVGPGERAMVPTGLAVAVPEGYAGLVLPRSGLASKQGLTLANAPGLIDAGYRGEVICAVVNLDPSTPVRIARGDRIYYPIDRHLTPAGYDLTAAEVARFLGERFPTALGAPGR